MKLEQFLAAATVFKNLGDAIGDQLIDVAEGADLADQNLNAMRACRPLLRLLSCYGVDGAGYALGKIDRALSEANLDRTE